MKHKKAIENFKLFMDDEINEINREKWLAGEKMGCDPGEAFVYDWIIKKAKEFRKQWIEKHPDVEL